MTPRKQENKIYIFNWNRFVSCLQWSAWTILSQNTFLRQSERFFFIIQSLCSSISRYNHWLMAINFRKHRFNAAASIIYESELRGKKRSKRYKSSFFVVVDLGDGGWLEGLFARSYVLFSGISDSSIVRNKCWSSSEMSENLCQNGLYSCIHHLQRYI